MSKATNPKILIIATGGTICMTNKGDLQSLKPGAFASKELRNQLNIPTMPDCVFTEWEELIDSSDITLDHWVRLAEMIKTNYDSYNGFVILHGTDTLAFTASALSFMLEYLSKPVILTGAMLPIHHIQSDALTNIAVASMIAAYTTIPEVCVLFGSNLFRGNRVTKVDCFKKDAFRSPNFPALGHIGVDIKINDLLLMLTPKRKLSVFKDLCMNILVVDIVPQFNAQFLRTILENHKPPFGLILKFFGSGTAPAVSSELSQVLEHGIKAGITVVVITQCLKGTCSLLTYENGCKFYRLGVIEGKDLTLEAAFAKLAYLLGKGYSGMQLRAYMEMELRGEITERFSKVTGQLSIIENEHVKHPLETASTMPPQEENICQRVHAEAKTCITMEQTEIQERGPRDFHVPYLKKDSNTSE